MARLKWHGNQQAMREHYEAVAKTGGQKRPKKKHRRRKKSLGAACERGELTRMHADVRYLCSLLHLGPGTEGFSLMAALGASMGCWPRLTKAKVEELRARHKAMMGGQPPRPKPTDAMSPCQRCSQLTEEIRCLSGGYWVCPRCEGVLMPPSKRTPPRKSSPKARTPT